MEKAKSQAPKLSENELKRCSYCNDCGWVDRPKTKTPGSIWLEIALWLCCGIGILYSIWRLCSKYKCCAKCGSRSIIPADSPNAMKRRAEVENSHDA